MIEVVKSGRERERASEQERERELRAAPRELLLTSFSRARGIAALRLFSLRLQLLLNLLFLLFQAAVRHREIRSCTMARCARATRR